MHSPSAQSARTLVTSIVNGDRDGWNKCATPTRPAPAPSPFSTITPRAVEFGSSIPYCNATDPRPCDPSGSLAHAKVERGTEADAASAPPTPVQSVGMCSSTPHSLDGSENLASATEPPSFTTPSGGANGQKRKRTSALLPSPVILLRAAPSGPSSCGGWYAAYEFVREDGRDCAASPLRPHGVKLAPPKPRAVNASPVARGKCGIGATMARGGLASSAGRGMVSPSGKGVVQGAQSSPYRGSCNVCNHSLPQRLGRSISPTAPSEPSCPLHTTLAFRMDVHDNDSGVVRDVTCPPVVSVALLTRVWESLDDSPSLWPGEAVAAFSTIESIIGVSEVSKLLLGYRKASSDTAVDATCRSMRIQRLYDICQSRQSDGSTGSGCSGMCKLRPSGDLPFSLRCFILSLTHAWLVPESPLGESAQAMMTAMSKQQQCVACAEQRPLRYRLPFAHPEWSILSQALGTVLHASPYRLSSQPVPLSRDDTDARSGAAWKADGVVDVGFASE